MHFKTIILLFIIVPFANGQSEIELRSGLLISKVNSRVETIPDSLKLDSGSIAGMIIGFNYRYRLNEKNLIFSGLEYQGIGEKDFANRIESPDLRINYLSIPIGFERIIKDNISISLAYLFNYTFRINKNIRVFRDGEFLNEDGFIYNNFNHSASIGLKYSFDRFSVGTNLYTNLTKLWDSKQFFDDGLRWFGNYKAISIQLNYIFKDDDN